MAIDTVGRKAATYFIGTEVENTAMYGERTLFVVGVQPVDKIASIILNQNSYIDKTKHIRHVYLGTSQSFTPASKEEWDAWDKMIRELLEAELWVTLDFGVEYAPDVNEYSWHEYNNFIAMLSVKLPYIKHFNYNTTLKLDDTTWGHSNPGIWCHSLHDLMDRKVYTDWKDYIGDEEINED